MSDDRILLVIKDEKLHEALKKFAKSDNRTMIYIVEKALSQFLLKYAK